MRSRSGSSAQCTSSKPSTSGCALGERRRPLLRGPGDLLPASAPTVSSTPEASPSRSATASLEHSLSFSNASSGSPRARSPLRPGPSRPAVCGRALLRREASAREHGRALEPREELADRLFPMPGSPKIVELRPPVADGPRERVLQQVELLLSADVGRHDMGRPIGRSAQTRAAPPCPRAAPEGAPTWARSPRGRRGRAVGPIRISPGSPTPEPGRDVQRLAGREGRVTVLDDDLPASMPIRTGARRRRSRRWRRLRAPRARRRPRAPSGRRRPPARRLRESSRSCRRTCRCGSDAVEEPVTFRHDLRVARGDQGRGVDEIDEHRRRQLALHTLSLGSAEGVREAGNRPFRRLHGSVRRLDACGAHPDPVEQGGHRDRAGEDGDARPAGSARRVLTAARRFPGRVARGCARPWQGSSRRS